MPATNEPTYLRPAIVVAVLSTVLGLVLTCVFVALGWLHDRAGSFTGVFAGGVRAWLVSHGSGINAAGVEIGAVPLGATGLAIVLVFCVTLKALDEPPEATTPFIAIASGTYAVLAGILSLASNSDDYSTHVLRSVIGAFVVAVIGSGLGVARRNRSFEPLWPTDNTDVRSVVIAASRGVAVLLAAAFGIFIILFASHIDRASDVWAALDPGFLGAFGLGALCLVLVPNLVLFAGSALLGPGFALGTNTSVDLTGSHLGAVPGLPVLAALPGPGEFAGWVFILGLIPLLAGMYAGWRADGGADRTLIERIGLGLAAGALAGLVCGVLIALSGGSVGPGRMADVGPPRSSVVLVAIGILALGGAIGGALGHYRGTRAHNSPIARPGLWSRHKSPSLD